MVESWTPELSLAQFIDHTLLKPTASERDILQLCKEAITHKFYSVCVNGSWVSYCRKQLAGSDIRISAVCGFPLGAMSTKAKVFEAVNAVEDGAKEIDMVLSIGAVLEGRYDKVSDDIAAVVKAVEKRAIVKVILETGYLNDRQKAEDLDRIRSGRSNGCGYQADAGIRFRWHRRQGLRRYSRQGNGDPDAPQRGQQAGHERRHRDRHTGDIRFRAGW